MLSYYNICTGSSLHHDNKMFLEAIEIKISAQAFRFAIDPNAISSEPQNTFTRVWSESES